MHFLLPNMFDDYELKSKITISYRVGFTVRLTKGVNMLKRYQIPFHSDDVIPRFVPNQGNMTNKLFSFFKVVW